MRKKISTILLFVTVMLLPWRALAANLMQVYRQALASDPTYQAAQAQYLATAENAPIAFSALLPNINGTGQIFRQKISQKLGDGDVISPFSLVPVETFYNTSTMYALNLTQPVFNFASWASVATAESQVKQAESTYFAALQNLMIRTSQAYFGVLQASDALRFTQAQKQAIGRQLQQTKQQYEVGLIAITAYEQSKASYDSISAQEIAAKNNLANAIEQLRTITGKTYTALMGPNSQLPLVSPHPADIMQWVCVSERQNYQLLATQYGADAAEENIKVRFGGHLPVINAQANYMFDNETNAIASAGIGGRIGTTTETSQIGLTMTLPIYQGGLVNSQTRQARALYEQSIANMEFTHRGVIAQTRNAYLGIIAGISQIHADQQAIISNQLSLRATEAAFQVGTGTMVDVLRAISDLYQSQRNYANDQYTYLLNTLSLKQSAGTLSDEDLAIINSWLKKPVSIAEEIAGIDIATKSGILTRPTTSYVDRERARRAAMVSTESVGMNLRDKATREKLRDEITGNVSQVGKSTDSKISEREVVSDIMNKKNTEKPQMHENLLAQNVDEHALLNINKNHYTLALFDGAVRQHAIDFITQHHLNGKAVYYTTKTDKGIRYRVVYGEYASEKAAKRGMKELPLSLQKSHPWIRKFSKVQQEINTN